MSSKRRSHYRVPPRHKWTAEQEHLVILSYIGCLDSDSRRPDYMKMMTWSEINERAIENYRLKFGHEPFVTAATIKYKVKWLRDVYDQKDTSVSCFLSLFSTYFPIHGFQLSNCSCFLL